MPKALTESKDISHPPNQWFSITNFNASRTHRKQMPRVVECCPPNLTVAVIFIRAAANANERPPRSSRSMSSHRRARWRGGGHQTYLRLLWLLLLFTPSFRGLHMGLGSQVIEYIKYGRLVERVTPFLTGTEKFVILSLFISEPNKHVFCCCCWLEWHCYF